MWRAVAFIILLSLVGVRVSPLYTVPRLTVFDTNIPFSKDAISRSEAFSPAAVLEIRPVTYEDCHSTLYDGSCAVAAGVPSHVHGGTSERNAPAGSIVDSVSLGVFREKILRRTSSALDGINNAFGEIVVS